MHPENVSEGVPCIISTNDDVLTVLASTSTDRTSNDKSVDAAVRRLYLIPFNMRPYEKLHGHIDKEMTHYEKLW